MGRVDLFSVLDELKQRSKPEAREALCCPGNREKCWLYHDHKALPPVSADQLTSLTALIVYVAHETGRYELQVERDLVDQFCLPNLKCLPEESFDHALRFLVERLPARSERA